MAESPVDEAISMPWKFPDAKSGANNWPWSDLEGADPEQEGRWVQFIPLIRPPVLGPEWHGEPLWGCRTTNPWAFPHMARPIPRSGIGL